MAQTFKQPVFVQDKNNSRCETVVLVDTNVILMMGEDIKAFCKIGLKIAVTRSILRELKRKDQNLYAYACANFVVINDSSQEIVTEAGCIYTHFPDNLLIATAKIKRLALISYDKVLLRVAVSQGVEACTPEQLIKSKKIFDRICTTHAVISQTTCTNVTVRSFENINSQRHHEMKLVETQRKENGEMVRIYRPLEGF